MIIEDSQALLHRLLQLYTFEIDTLLGSVTRFTISVSKICKHWLMVYWRYIVQMLVLFSKSIWFKLLQYQCFLLHLNDLETLILISWITETFQDKENEHFYHWQEFLLFHSNFSTIKAFLPCLYSLGTLILFSNYWNFSEKLYKYFDYTDNCFLSFIQAYHPPIHGFTAII